MSEKVCKSGNNSQSAQSISNENSVIAESYDNST